MDFEFKDKYDISDLLEIVKILRSENGCPWDKVQTHESIRTDLIEEAYEVCEGIDANSPEMLREELGDLLLQVAFHSQIETENGNFSFDDVCNEICSKLIFRHPHVFGEVKADTEEQVLKNWDALKKTEKHQESFTQTLESVPKNFPALLRGQKITRRAERAGLPINNAEQCIDKIKQGLDALVCDSDEENIAQNQQIIGNLLFCFCNLSRILKIDSEKALTYAINRFIMTFKAVEFGGSTLDKLSDDELAKLTESL